MQESNESIVTSTNTKDSIKQWSAWKQQSLSFLFYSVNISFLFRRKNNINIRVFNSSVQMGIDSQAVSQSIWHTHTQQSLLSSNSHCLGLLVFRQSFCCLHCIPTLITNQPICLSFQIGWAGEAKTFQFSKFQPTIQPYSTMTVDLQGIFK